MGVVATQATLILYNVVQTKALLVSLTLKINASKK
jgi:hypothetical protein